MVYQGIRDAVTSLTNLVRGGERPGWKHIRGRQLREGQAGVKAASKMFAERIRKQKSVRMDW